MPVQTEVKKKPSPSLKNKKPIKPTSGPTRTFFQMFAALGALKSVSEKSEANKK